MKKAFFPQSGRLCVLIFALLRTTSVHAQFDLASDFSTSDNPNGPWSFGWMPKDKDVFYLFTSTAAAYGVGLAEWQGPFPLHDGSSPPNVIQNTTTEPITISDTTWLPHAVTFHPGRYGERSVVRWTSPFSGAAGLSATFEGRSAFATAVVQIFHNESLLFTDWVWGHGEASRISLSTNLFLQVGDKVDFRLDYGNGDWTSDTTQISVSFDSVPSAKTLNGSPQGSRLRRGEAQFTSPAAFMGYQLETATRLTARAWTPVRNFQPTEAGGLKVMMNAADDSRVFRVRKE